MKIKWFNRIKKTIRNEKGSISIYVIIFMVFFLPFICWIGVQLPLKYEVQDSVKQITSNTTDSMISRLDSNLLADGLVEVDVNEAMQVADSMIRTSLNLDENGNPKGDGILQEHIDINGPYTLEDLDDLKVEDGAYVLPQDPGVYVYVLNHPSQINIKGLLPINQTSVIVQANIPVETKGLLGGRALIHKTGFSEAKIDTGVTP